MKNTFKFIMVVLTIVLLLSSAFGCNENSNSPKSSEEPAATAEPAKTISWRADTTGKYRDDDNVTSLICVEATEGTNARVLMFEKSKVNGKNVWTLTLECDGYIGKNGLGKTKEGDIQREFRDETQTPEETLLAEEKKEKLIEIINSLPNDQAMVIKMYHLEELGYEEISEILNVPLGTVKSRINRARKTLEVKLKDFIKE